MDQPKRPALWRDCTMEEMRYSRNWPGDTAGYYGEAMSAFDEAAASSGRRFFRCSMQSGRAASATVQGHVPRWRIVRERAAAPVPSGGASDNSCVVLLWPDDCRHAGRACEATSGICGRIVTSHYFTSARKLGVGSAPISACLDSIAATPGVPATAPSQQVIGP